MKKQIARVFIAFCICGMLLPLSTVVTAFTVEGDWNGTPSLTGGGSGSYETFDNVPAGTTHSFNDFSLFPNANTDVVVLDGRLWIVTRDDDSALVAKYSPSATESTWNISFDAFTPRNGASYQITGQVPGVYGLKAMLVGSDGRDITGIELLVGPAEREGILIYDSSSGTWTREAPGILPALSNRGTDQESAPDHYSVSIARTSAHVFELTVIHSRAGMVFTKSVTVNGATDAMPSLQLFSDVSVGFILAPGDSHGPYQVSGGWMLDNFATRPVSSRLATVQPDIEVVQRSDRQWVNVIDQSGQTIPDASVNIDGRQATFDPTSERYEVGSLMPIVDWTVPETYSVTVDGVTIDGQFKVTTISDPSPAFVTKWWNGWAWATVLGRDDCSGPQTVLNTYKGYDHPLTAYVFTEGPTGNSSMILPTQSEIAKHGPHDYYNWMKKNWTEAVASANQGQTSLVNAYDFASRWDDPSYVGNGDTYISLANPGNSASFQMEYAQYMAGIRIEGISSNLGSAVAGNKSLIGSWSLEPWANWDPMSPMDLMDASRHLNTDVASINNDVIMSVALNGGLARIYNHGTIAQPDLLHWICDNKTDPTLENWKATDGEATSYYYGRMTTDVRTVETGNANNMVFEVSRKDPKAAGYWLVPITIAVPLGNSTVDSIEVVGSDGTLSSLASMGGGLQNLSGKRVMDVGYDIRGGVLYVSTFWNESSELIIHLTPRDPSILNRPQTAIPFGSSYTFNATSTNGLGMVNWTLTTNASFLSVQWSDRTHCLVTGTPTAPGKYNVSITVSSSLHSDEINYTLNVWQPPDNEPPRTEITGEIGRWVNHSALFDLAATDLVSGVRETDYSIDGGAWRTWARSVLITTEGRHVVRYFSVDNAGNMEDVKEAAVLIDRHPPEARFENPEHQPFYGGRAMLRFAEWDNLSGIGSIYLLDGSGDRVAIQSGTGTYLLENVAVGDHTYVLQVSDMTGNMISVSVTIEMRQGGVMDWGSANMLTLTTLSLVGGVLCLTAVFFGRKAKG